jgi:cobalt-zinc-cadmium efflux system outer membrane protein
LHNVDNPDVAMVAGVSLPLPVPNRNLGSISEAGHRLAKAEKEKKAAEIRLLTRLRILHETLLARNEEISHLKDELLPESDRTLQASRQAYQLGKLSFLEVLDSQRILFELNSRYIATLAEYRQDWNELESLVSVNYGQVNQ